MSRNQRGLSATSELTFAESFDSVHSGYALSQSEREKAYIHAWVDAFLSLAFGRDLVTSTSYAFDSSAFQLVLADIAKADRALRKGVDGSYRNRNRPVLLHIFDAETSEEASRKILLRAFGLSDKPFESSLFPDLRKRAKGEFGVDWQERIENWLSVKDGALKIVSHLYEGDDRLRAYKSTYKYFRGMRVNDPGRGIAAKPKPRTTLQFHIDAFLEGCASRRRSPVSTASNEHRQEVDRRLRSALKKLKKTASYELDERSRLRATAIWSDERPIDDLVGKEDAGLVREFVDTLYNRVVVDSIGVAGALYSTRVGAASDIAREFVAQDFALDINGEGARVGTRVGVDIRITKDESALERLRNGLGANGSLVFEKLLAATVTPEWKDSIDSLREAQVKWDRSTIEERLRSHLGRLYEVLGWTAPAGRVRPVTTVIGIVIGALLGTNVVDPLVDIVIPSEYFGAAVGGVLGGTLPVLGAKGIDRLNQNRDRNKFLHTSGCVVGLAP